MRVLHLNSEVFIYFFLCGHHRPTVCTFQFLAQKPHPHTNNPRVDEKNLGFHFYECLWESQPLNITWFTLINGFISIRICTSENLFKLLSDFCTFLSGQNGWFLLSLWSACLLGLSSVWFRSVSIWTFYAIWCEHKIANQLKEFNGAHTFWKGY